MVRTEANKIVAESVLLTPQSSVPAAVEGKLYYSTLGTICFYNGTEWVAL